MECSGKGSLKMKTKLFVSLLLLTAAVAPGALAAAAGGDRNFHAGRGQLFVTPVDDPAVEDVPASPAVWRAIEEQDVARIPDVEAEPDSTHESEVVMVALPFSSLQLNPSLTTYLSLTSSQVEAIQQVMMREQHSLEPLMTALRTAREKLLAIGSEHVNEKELKAVADTEASLLARLIVANARMQSKIYKILSPEQQKKLSDLERTQGAVKLDSK